MRPKCNFIRRKAPVCPAERHGHFLTFYTFQRLNLLSSNFHCRCLLKSVRAACEQHYVDLCAYAFMPDHVHMLILPQAAEHDIAVFANGVRENFSKRVLAHPREKALRPFRVREKSGVRGYRFWQAGRGFDEIIKTPKAAIARAHFCELDPIRQSLPPASRRWSFAATRAAIKKMWGADGWRQNRPPASQNP